MSKTLNMVGGGAKGLFASILATGVSQSDTVTLTTPSGTTKSGKWVSRPNPESLGLPDAYQEVEYLESHGNEHINTNIYPSENNIAEFGFCLSSVKSDDMFFFGGADNSNHKFSASTRGNTYNFYGDCGSNKNGPYLSFDRDTTTWHDASVEFIGNTCTVNLDGSTNTVTSLTPTATQNTYPIFLFALNHHGTASYKAIYKCPHFRLRIDSVLRCDYVPCYRKADNKPGMYDLVTGEFLTNAGTGEFSVGADVPDSIGGFLFDKLGEFGTYTLTASNGDDTVSETVLVDVVSEYRIEIEYNKLYLYKNGDECEDVTGGWVSDGTGTATKEAESFYLNITSTSTGSWYGAAFRTNNKIDLSQYSKLYAEMTIISKTGYGDHCIKTTDSTGIATGLDKTNDETVYRGASSTDAVIMTVDLTNKSNPVYVMSSVIAGGSGSNWGSNLAGTHTLRVHKVWAEK